MGTHTCVACGAAKASKALTLDTGFVCGTNAAREESGQHETMNHVPHILWRLELSHEQDTTGEL